MKRAISWVIALSPLFMLALAYDAAGQADDKAEEKSEGSAVKRILSKDREPAAPAEAEASTPADESTAPAEAPAAVEEEGGEPAARTGLARGEGSVKLDLGKESDDDGKTVDVFADPEVKRLIGDNPRFRYDSEGVIDPMIFPPVRNEAIRNEVWTEQEKLLAEAGVDPKKKVADNSGATAAPLQEALRMLGKVLELNDARYVDETKERMEYIESVMRVIDAKPIEGGSGTTPPPPPKDIPAEVEQGFSGVIYSESGPICLIMDSMLKVGETIPDYPYIKVVEIHPTKVVLETSNEAGATQRETLEVGDVNNFNFE